MSQLISEIWEGLCSAGLTEVMLYLPDNSAARCNWRDTAVIAGVRVALIADQERKIVRLVPVDGCSGIGVASPKGVDPTGHRSFVLKKISEQFAQPPDRFRNVEEPEPASETPAEPARPSEPPPQEPPAAATPAPTPPAPEPAPAPQPAPNGRFGGMARNPDSRTPTTVGHGPHSGSSQGYGPTPGVPRPGERGWNRS